METILDFYYNSYFFHQSIRGLRGTKVECSTLNWRVVGSNPAADTLFFLSNRSFYAKFRSNLGHKIINCTFQQILANMGGIWMKSTG